MTRYIGSVKLPGLFSLCLLSAAYVVPFSCAFRPVAEVRHVPPAGVLTRIGPSDGMELYTTGYEDAAGNVVIPANRYAYCFTEVFDRVAIVLHKVPGETRRAYHAIDRAERILFEVAAWDNGPDEVRDGLFRIVVDGRMGFADMNGDIVIRPVFSSALPFSEGLAAFCVGGVMEEDGEYTGIAGGRWGFIDTDGTVRISARFDGAGSFKNGTAVVRKDGVTCRIDTSGNIVDRPRM